MIKKKLIKRICIIVFVLVTLFAGLFITYKLFFDPYRNTIQTSSLSLSLSTTLTKAEALEDLSYTLSTIKKSHPACMDGVPIDVQSQYDIEVARLTERVTVLELWQSCARILSRMKDAHTNVRYNSEDTRSLPLTFDMKNGELFCTSAEYSNYKIISINGVSWKEYSYKYFGRIDESKSDLALIPDYEVKAEYALDKLYEIIDVQR